MDALIEDNTRARTFALQPCLVTATTAYALWNEKHSKGPLTISMGTGAHTVPLCTVPSARTCSGVSIYPSTLRAALACFCGQETVHVFVEAGKGAKITGFRLFLETEPVLLSPSARRCE